MQEEFENPQNRDIFHQTGLSGSPITGPEASLAVAAALRFQHRFFVRELGGLLADLIPLEAVRDVLDFLCGPGSWCMDLSKHYPQTRVVGVDINPEMVRISQEDAATATSNPPTFQVIEALEHLPFPDNSFDVIHLEGGTMALRRCMWPSMLRELSRILRPGGWLYLVDAEPGPVSSPALDQLLTLISQVLLKTGRSISPDGSQPFTTSVLIPRLLQQAGYTEVNYRLHPLNLGGWNNPAGRAYTTAAIAGHPLLPRAITIAGLATAEEIHTLLKEVRQQVQQIDFCGAGVLVSVTGRKP